MAWNPSPKIADLRELAKKWNADQVIVLAINTRMGTFEVNSFGKTRELCGSANAIANDIYDMVTDGTIDTDQ